MRIDLNGRPAETTATTLAEALIELGFAGRPVATALNGDFIAAGFRGETALRDGDRIEVLTPMQGG
jgi:sulfur carrier protein